MTQALQFLNEINREAAATRKILAAVPIEKADWKPHEKSMTLGRLATHVAEIPSWFKVTLQEDVLDFAASEFMPYVAKSNDELLQMLDKNLKTAEAILSTFPDEKMQDLWTMRAGETVFFSLPKEEVARTWCMNHWYHHRAQLGVYLRLLNVPLPGTYGPSADTQ